MELHPITKITNVTYHLIENRVKKYEYGGRATTFQQDTRHNIQEAMPPKKIIVADGTGAESKEKLSNEEGCRNMIAAKGVECLIDVDGFKIRDFDSLENEGVYKLGPPLLQQQQQVSIVDLCVRRCSNNCYMWKSPFKRISILAHECTR